MCIRSSQYFTRCGHRDTKLARCPEYYKQRSSGSGLLSCLFQKKKKQDCGKAVPYYIELESFCQACTFSNSSPRTKDVGYGAFRAQQSTAEDDFRNARKHAAKESYKTAKHSRQGKKHNHEVISVKPSVWLPDLCHHPDTMALSEKYAREPAPAPPVPSLPEKSSRRKGLPHDSSRKGAKSTVPNGHFNKNYEYNRHTAVPETPSVNANRTPAFSTSKPQRTPADPSQTYQYRGKFAGNAPNLPPAGGLSQFPSRARPEAAGGKPPRPPRPSVPTRKTSGTESTGYGEKHPKLRHKDGRIYNVAAVRPPKVPVPEYQVYLNAMSYVAEKSPSNKQKLARPTHQSQPKARPNTHHRYTKEEPRRSALQTFMGRSSANNDDGSDVSFVCQDSRKLMEPKARRRVDRR
ncbi:hypothetical protein F4809DRAFT_530605 [Biscogniauxia mediterranea]|nr:hypothetical protein F4809DRAFT_530605 [Biscogniauxia mediterranea]